MTYWYSASHPECERCLPTLCELQSEEYVVAPPMEGLTTTAEQTTTFMDTAEGVKVGSGVNHSKFDIADAVTAAGLPEFLSRPVRISSFFWDQSQGPGVVQDMRPWNLFFNNANIKYKLNNFAFIRANLKLKFVINASPFYYGSMRACYQPLPAFKTSTIGFGSSGLMTNSELVPLSQQPGIWLKPQHSEGAELTLPFFYPRSFLRLQNAQDFTDMGQLRMVIYNSLLSANGATGAGVSVQIYAWAEDVVLAGPSVGLALQADEYGVSPISGPASTVGRIARMFKSTPVIGKFATATEIGANAVSGIAKLFGFTNVPVIESTKPLRPTPFPQLASADIGYPVEKLTLDSKNELSVDPSIMGLASDDELIISKFAGKESYIATSQWTTSTPVDTPLFSSKVTPSLGFGYPSGTGQLKQYTPMGLLSLLFKSWRGDIIFRFRFVASAFHKGRVRISYDPYNAAVLTTADTGPTVYNQVVDLAAETDVEVRVPYQQALAWCYTYTNDTGLFSTATSPTLAFDDTYDNGLISVKVLTALSAPVLTSTVYMQVFVRAADNIEFANPITIGNRPSPFVVQSEEYSEKPETEQTVIGETPPDLDIQRTRVNFGENIVSLRTLMRRSNYLDTVYIPTAGSTGDGCFRVRQTRFPLHYGYDPNGWNLAKGISAPAVTFPINFVAVTPWHLISNCFVGQKGSMHWTYNVYKGTAATTMQISRDTELTTGVSAAWDIKTVSTNSSTNAQNLLLTTSSTTAGAALINQNTISGVSVSVPNQSVFKFQTTDPRNSSSPGNSSSSRYDGSCFETFNVEIMQSGAVFSTVLARFDRYFAIGTDYSLFFFLNCPSMYELPPDLPVPA